MAEDKNTFPIINLEEKHIKFESLCVNSSSGIIKNLEFKLASFERFAADLQLRNIFL